MFDWKYVWAVHTHTPTHTLQYKHTVVALSDTTAVNLSWRENLFEGPSSCMCVSLAELRGTMTGKKPTGGEWGVSTQRVCIQTLINSVLLSSLPGTPAFLGHMPVTWMVCISACVCVLCVWKHHNMSPAFVFVLSPHPHLARLPSHVRFREASWSHRMDHNYPLLGMNPCPPNKSFYRLYP